MTENIDAKEFLNEKLKSFPPIKYSDDVWSEKKVCVKEYAGYNDKGPTTYFTKCHTESHLTQSAYSAFPEVIETEIAEVLNLKFHEEKLVELPLVARSARRVVENSSKVPYTTNVTLSVTARKTQSITKTKTVAASKGLNLNLKYDSKVGAGISTTFSFSETVTVTDTKVDTIEETVSQTHFDSLTVPAYSAIAVDIIVYEVAIEIPFSADLVLDGNIKPNSSGISRASELLSLDVRTVPFEGVLKLQNVSLYKVRLEDLPLKLKEIADGEQITISEANRSTFVVNKDLHSILGQFGSPQEALELRHKSARAVFDASNGSIRDSTISPYPDGIFYTVLNSRSESRPDVRCGFSDLGMPNLATFTIEVREYYQTISNEIVSRWVMEEEMFQSCWSA